MEIELCCQEEIPFVVEFSVRKANNRGPDPDGLRYLHEGMLPVILAVDVFSSESEGCLKSSFIASFFFCATG